MILFRPLTLAGAAALLASAATAQTTTAQGTTMGRDWDAPIVDTFFNPGGTMTLRTDGEVRSSWESLSEEQKQQVRDDCAAFGTEGTAAGSAAGGTSDAAGGSDAAASSGEGGTSDTAATGAEGGLSDQEADAGTAPTGGAASPVGQPTGDRAAQSGSSTVTDSDAGGNVVESETGTTAGPGTSDERVTVADQAASGTPAEQGTGATTNPAADTATTGTGEGSLTASNDTGTATGTEAGTDATPGTREFDQASVSLTSWTQICQMVESF
ncbi:hypothetical protein [Cereibacter johrii]|uniref:hypothetical protein n=1 Tax=Cereibacter johrii TaxID=445629 RepID=UPI000DCC1AA8|nr:hypothetical protein [Cereibacter johrii]RAZ83226.1 hypothetical protein DDV93_12945 [Cereibacter johrii]